MQSCRDCVTVADACDLCERNIAGFAIDAFSRSIIIACKLQSINVFQAVLSSLIKQLETIDFNFFLPVSFIIALD